MTVSKVLQLKDRRKEALEIEAKRLKDMVELEDSKLDTLEKSLSDMIVTFREKQIGKVINLHEIGMFYDYAEKLNSEIKVQKVKINNFLFAQYHPFYNCNYMHNNALANFRQILSFF